MTLVAGMLVGVGHYNAGTLLWYRERTVSHQ